MIDLATARAQLAGRLLADLGAEVLAVEPPGGAPERHWPPFELGREGDGDGSLYWAAVALGKRSLTLDIHEQRDRERLRRLLAGADVFIESFDPGTLDGLGLGYEAVRELNPALVYVSVTPWGQDGPRAGGAATELTVEAAGGLVWLQGDRDRPPIPVGYPQAAFHAGAQAAADAVVALNERLRSGRGQRLDVSMQAAVVWTLMNATGYPPNQGTDPPGLGEDRGQPPPQTLPGVTIPSLVECADGVALVGLRIGGPGARTLVGVLRWLEEEQPLPERLRSIDWPNWGQGISEGSLDPALANEAIGLVLRFLRTKTKRELMDRGVRGRPADRAHQYDGRRCRRPPAGGSRLLARA